MCNLVENSSTPAQLANTLSPVLSAQNVAIDSKTLFAFGDVVFIQHRGERYLLRRTRNGKLILTK